MTKQSIVYVAIAATFCGVGVSGVEAMRERHYSRPALESMNPEQRHCYREETKFLRAFGVRYRPDICDIKLIDEAAGCDAENFKMRCRAFVLGQMRTHE